jgi:hypothetical protein
VLSSVSSSDGITRTALISSSASRIAVLSFIYSALSMSYHLVLHLLQSPDTTICSHSFSISTCYCCGQFIVKSYLPYSSPLTVLLPSSQPSFSLFYIRFEAPLHSLSHSHSSSLPILSLSHPLFLYLSHFPHPSRYHLPVDSLPIPVPCKHFRRHVLRCAAQRTCALEVSDLLG